MTDSTSPIPTRKGMSFGEAMFFVATEKKRVRRLEWPDDGTYVTLISGQLHIFTPPTGKLHQLIVSDGDILGDDWEIIEIH
jgi:hypothetical protein